MIMSIVSFSFLVGNEIGVVSAGSGFQTTCSIPTSSSTGTFGSSSSSGVNGTNETNGTDNTLIYVAVGVAALAIPAYFIYTELTKETATAAVTQTMTAAEVFEKVKAAEGTIGNVEEAEKIIAMGSKNAQAYLTTTSGLEEGTAKTITNEILKSKYPTVASKASESYLVEELGLRPDQAQRALENTGNWQTSPLNGKEGGEAIFQQIKSQTAEDGWSKFSSNAVEHIGDLAINLGIAVGLYFASKFVGQLLGLDAETADRLGWCIGLGYGIGSTVGWVGQMLGNSEGLFASVFGESFTAVTWMGLLGLGIGILIFIFTSKTKKVEAREYTCYSWQPLSGGKDCEKCNNEDYPCSKYKCESLGQQCELINEGTGEEMCVWNNKNDIAPPIISSWDEPLDKENYEYTPDKATLPPDKGVIIKYKNSEDGCIPPFTKVYYGIELDEPATCRVSLERTDTYEEMETVLSNGVYRYKHTLMSLHGGINGTGENSLSLDNDGEYELYIRCEDKAGNTNVGTFVFKYCVSEEPDLTAPSIELTDPVNNMPVAQGTSSMDIHVYVNKPADCRWSHNDEAYDVMTEQMSCAQGVTEINANALYKCSTTLTGLKDEQDNTFYFRCKSYPGYDEADRHENKQSYVYNLVGTKKLVLDWAEPNGTLIKDSTDMIKVTLKAHTSAGYKDGQAQCYSKQSSQSDTSYILFMNTNSYEHSQDLWLTRGQYNYDIRCCDLGGNCDKATIGFEVDTDKDSPIIVRAYKDSNKLKIITNEEAECVYDTMDCSYAIEDGVDLTTSDHLEHYTDWDTDNTLYIKCQDEFGNEPSPNECSIVARPFSDY